MTTTADRPVVDPATPLGAKVAPRLEQEGLIWLTTVGSSGTPQPNPVWFQWRDGEFLIFSEPGQAKLRNIKRNPRVSLNLNTDGGYDVGVLTGNARIDDSAPSAAELEAYAIKYAAGLKSLGMTAEKFFATYSVAIRVAPDRLRGF
ncbi:TIGR03667 family PPOX class F420-dependent oxidoreductase [Nocardia sp. XZ_19_385]|uniref:TIGR03667 family PPOX class F420-dependent oxidoreductase n=1 Tax=Nocardia sp. XZ_19_385 TaxID=2769488 RepID=UPI00188F5A4E|nr:TIGR03667 family PPOX class F420-dependent oxidoreductase [Nocardia sp. XZ_19_385]